MLVFSDNNSKKIIYYFHGKHIKINMGHNTNVYICLSVCVCLYYMCKYVYI